MLTKHCELCGNSFSCYGDEKTCWCQKMSINAEKLDTVSNFGIDCFCENFDSFITYLLFDISYKQINYKDFFKLKPEPLMEHLIGLLK